MTDQKDDTSTSEKTEGANLSKWSAGPKVTATELEIKFAERRAKRKTKKAAQPPKKLGTVVRAVVAAGLLVGIFAMSQGINSSTETTSTTVQFNEKKVESLNGALEALSPTDGKITTKKLIDGLAAAQKQSDDLATAQQGFATIAFAGNSDKAPQDGRPKASVLKSLSHRKAIAKYFAPSSLILTDAEAYNFRTEDLLDSGRIDPRLAWFTSYEHGTGGSTFRKATNPASYVWKSVSVTPSGTPDVFTVVWTNTDTKTGTLFAWASARYSATNNTFSNLTVTTTTQGDSRLLKPPTSAAATAGLEKS